MPDYHKYDGKFGDTPDKIAKQDPAFRKGMKEAIEGKNLRQVLIYASRKAQAAAAELRLTEIETFQFAYEIFVSVFDEVKMPEDRKEKMAETVNERLLEAVGVVTSKKMGVSPEYAEKMVAEQLETGAAAAPQVAPVGNVPNLATNVPVSPPMPSLQRPASPKAIGYHKYSDEYGGIASQILSQDSTLRNSLVMSIESKNLKQLLLSLIKKVQDLAPNLGIAQSELHQIAYELFATIFTEISIPAEQKGIMANTVDIKLIEAMRAAPAAPPLAAAPAPAITSAPLPNAPQKPKVFSSGMLSPTAATDQTPPSGYTLQEMLGGNSLVQSNSGVAESQITGSPGDAMQANLVEQRNILRAQRQAEQAASAASQQAVAKPTTVGFDPFATMDQWLRSDKKLIKMVDHFEKRGPNVIRVVLDPESEGYVPYIDMALKVSSHGDKNIIRAECVGELGLKYPYSMAVGDNGKKWVAVSLFDNIPADENETVDQLKKVDLKNQLEWDQLMVMLNNDKFFMNNVKSLQLKNPANSKEIIKVPVYIKKDIPSNKAIVHTFITPGLKPSTIFFDIMDHIAENLAQLGDSGDSTISASLSMKFDQISQQTQQSMASHSMRFLAQDDSNLTYKTCPYCGRPFPNPNADYRRCPNCLAKLK